MEVWFRSFSFLWWVMVVGSICWSSRVYFKNSEAKSFEWNWWGEVSGLGSFATVGEVYYAKWHYMKYCTQVIKYSLRRNTDPDSDAKRKSNRKNLKNCYLCLPLFDVEMIWIADWIFRVIWLFQGSDFFVGVLLLARKLFSSPGETCAYEMRLKTRRPWHRRILGDEWMLVPILINLTSWWFQILFIFTPTWGNDPIWLIFFKWVETTN